jgi:hypothetical protein
MGKIMLEIFAGSIIASPYSQRRISGFNLPILSKLTTHTRATTIASYAVRISKTDEFGKIISLKNLRKCIPDDSNRFNDYDICSYVFCVLAMINGKGLIIPEIISLINDERVSLIMRKVCEVSYWIRNNYPSELVLGNFLKDIDETSSVELIELRRLTSISNIYYSILTGVIASLTLNTFERAIKASLYVGGCREISMMVIGLISTQRNIPIPANISHFCRIYLANNKI